ncbi:uncharacterized protein ACRADG_003229 [Cochliomyia hominivorax]
MVSSKYFQKFFIVLCALVAAAFADVSHLPSNKYLPPSHAASTPAVSYAAPATQSYHVEAASTPAVSYSAPASQSYHVEAASAPAASYSAPVEAAPAASYETASYDTSASEPAHTFSSTDGYSYKTVKRRVIRRRRRDVSHLPSNEYLPPVAASAPVASYETSYAASEPAVSYASPASYETGSYETAASVPAHSFSSADGYRYKTAKRRVIRRRRRDVSHLPSNEYLPPVAASAPVASYETSYAASEPAVSYASPASYETASYETAASVPAHSFSSADGYRYKTAKRRVIRRRRRDVSHLPSNEYLPPVAASAPVPSYETSYAASEPAVSYASPASYETASHETAASVPAHSFSSADGYRYKTAKRRVIRRRRRDVSTEYLPPAASAPVAQYDSAPSYSAFAPASSYETTSYETAASEPAHSYSSADGYRYKTARRRVIRRRRRDVSHLSTEYLPPHQGAASTPSVEYLPPAASAPVAQYESAPSYSVASSAPVASYGSYETAASEPAHSFSSAEGYRYKTARRRVIRRRRRDVSHLSTEYLPPHQGAASTPSVDYLPPAASAPVAQYESAPSYSVAASAPFGSYGTASYETAASVPAHSFSSADGYRYKTAKRRVVRRRRF